MKRTGRSVAMLTEMAPSRSAQCGPWLTLDLHVRLTLHCHRTCRRWTASFLLCCPWLPLGGAKWAGPGPRSAAGECRVAGLVAWGGPALGVGSAGLWGLCAGTARGGTPCPGWRLAGSNARLAGLLLCAARLPDPGGARGGPCRTSEPLSAVQSRHRFLYGKEQRRIHNEHGAASEGAGTLTDS